jgi:sugar lactone lactonase YvrE
VKKNRLFARIFFVSIFILALFAAPQVSNADNACTANLSNDLTLSVPIVTYAGQAYWADFQYVPNTMDFAVTNIGVVDDLSQFSTCAAATLSPSLQLQIPIVIFNGVSYWADFQYDQGVNFILTEDGANPSTPGGGSGSPTTPPTLLPGTTFSMPANSSVLVPAGTIISSPNGSTITVNGSGNVINTQAGATVSVPSTATGPANNLVSTGQSSPGNISTSSLSVNVIAGSATTNLSPVDGIGTAAIFWGGGHLALDSSGNIIVSDRGALRKVTQAGVVTTLVGGYNPADFEGIAIDNDGNIYGSGCPDFVSTAPVTWGASIYKYTAAGTLVGFAINWETSTTNPSIGWGGLAVDGNGNLYLADTANNRIVKFTSTGIMSVFAGNGTVGEKDGVGTSSTFDGPTDLAIDSSGNLYVNDNGNNAIRNITPDALVSTIATFQNLGTPIAVDSEGNIYAVSLLSVILRIDPQGNIFSSQVPQISDFITALVADGKGNLFTDTRGVGAQILKISF